MDEGGNPSYLVPILFGVIVLLAILLIGMIIVYCRQYKKGFKNVVIGDLFHANEDVTEEEIISIVKEGHEQGAILDSEAEMIHNILEFDDKTTKDIMTHRKNLIAIDGELSYLDAVSFIIETGKSRFPVYANDIDNIIGVLHIKDAFAYAQRNEVFRTSIKDIPGLVRSVDFVPETLNINVLFKKMQTKKSHMVMVVDEYGQIAGVVAMEDILEEIVGNIQDEHDNEKDLIEQKADGSYIVDGLVDFSEIVELLELPVETDSFETMNGFLISLLDKIPSEGENAKLQAYGYEFQVLKVEDKMIRRVMIQRAIESNQQESELALNNKA